MRPGPALAISLAALALAGRARAMSLDEAIAMARKSNPTLAQTQAQADAAQARLSEADAGRLPTLTLSGQAAGGTTNLGGFFGFGRASVYPRQVALELRQPLYAGGGITAAIDRAREARDAAVLQVGGARALLSAQTAEAYVAVLDARELARLDAAEAGALDEIARQAQLRFDAGEIPRTDLAEAQARQARARAGVAQAEGDLARAESRFQSVVGVAPDALEPPGAPPAVPASLDRAADAAAQGSPTLLAARASLRAAEDTVRAAEAERLPTLAVTAQASSIRDQFFPGYRDDGVTVGVEGRWTLFSGGLVSGQAAEARAGVRQAQAALDAARAQVREAVVDAWADVEESRAAVLAAADQAAAAQSALDSVRQEVRVGQKPILDLLNAEDEALAADSAQVEAKGAAIVAAYRLNALLQTG